MTQTLSAEPFLAVLVPLECVAPMEIATIHIWCFRFGNLAFFGYFMCLLSICDFVVSYDNVNDRKDRERVAGSGKRGFNPLTYPITLFTQRQHLCIGSSSKQWDIFPKVCTARVSQFHVQWICIVMMKADTHMKKKKNINQLTNKKYIYAMHTRFWPYAMWFIYFHDSVCAIDIVEKKNLVQKKKKSF